MRISGIFSARHLCAVLGLAAALGAGTPQAPGALLLDWDFTGASAIVSQTANTIGGNLDTGGSYNNLTRGAGAGTSAGASSFRTTGFQNNGIATGNTDYFQFILSASASYTLSLSSIDGAFVGTTTYSVSPGVSNQWAYSTNGSTFTLIGSAQMRIGNGNVSFDLSGVSALQSVAAGLDVTLRYYASGQTSTGGWGFNSAGLTVSGTVASAASAPTVTTVAASATNTTTATVGGNVTADGGATVTNRGVCYKTSASVTISDNKTPTNGTTGAFTVDLSSLSVNQIYYYKAYAQNSAGTTLGSELNFTTYANAPSAPTVNNPTASTLDIAVNENSNPGTTEFAIQRTNDNYYLQADGTFAAGVIWATKATWGTKTATGLSASTTYYIQVKARNSVSNETAFGAVSNGTTSAGGTGIWINPMSAGTPMATYYLGDTMGEFYVNFEIGQASWDYAQLGIGTNTAGTDYNWGAAGWYEDGTWPNKRVRRNLTGYQYTIAGSHYVICQAKANSGDPYTSKSGNGWTNSQTYPPVDLSSAYFTCSALNNPSGPSATAASASQINLGWTRGVSGVAKDTVIFRSTSSTPPTLSGGTSYSQGTTYSGYYCVYKGSGTSQNDSASLSAGTQYYYFFYAENSSYYSAGVTTNATTWTTPSVTTVAASATNTTTATLGGNVTADGGATVTNRGVCYKTTATVTIGDNKTPTNGTTGAFTVNLSSLSVNQIYYFKAYAQNSVGTTLGTELNFTTLANVPSVPTVNNPTATTLDVAVNENGNPAATEFAIQRTSDSNYLQADGSWGASAIWATKAVWGTKTATGLSSGTSYSIQVKARNGASVETAFGSSASGLTICGTPATPTAGSLATDGFTASWSATTGAASYRLDVATDSGFTALVSGYNNLTVGGTSQAISGLTPGRTYYVRIRAVNASGTGANSATLTQATDCFTTGPVIGAATPVGSTNFTANWSAVTGATGYQLDVSTNATFGGGGGASDLFISEYIESSAAGEKYIEIYNGTGVSVDLSNYALLNFPNGAATPTYSNALSGTLTNGGVAIYKNSAATNSGTVASSVSYNGDDAVALWKCSSTSYADIFGRIGEDPGTAWTAGTTTTVDKVLVRKSTVTNGVTSNPGSGFPTLGTEWDMYNDGDESHLDSHTFSGGGAPSFVPGFSNLTVAGTSQLVTGLVAATEYFYRARATNAYCTSSYSSTTNVTTSAGMPYIALDDNGTQVGIANVEQETLNHVLLQFQLAPTNAGASLTNVTFTSTGTYDANDLTNFKLWYSTDATLDGGDDTLGTISSPGVAGAQTFVAAEFSQGISKDATNYFFITADIAAGADVGNTAGVGALDTNNVQFAAGVKTGSTAAGGAQTIISSVPGNTLRYNGFEGTASDNWSWTPSTTAVELGPRTITNSAGSYSLMLAGSDAANLDPTILFDNVRLPASAGDVAVSVAFACSGADSGDNLFLEVSYDNGSTWPVSTQLVTGASNLTNHFGQTQAGTADANPYLLYLSDNATNVRVRIRYDEAAAGTNLYDEFYIDELKLLSDVDGMKTVAFGGTQTIQIETNTTAFSIPITISTAADATVRVAIAGTALPSGGSADFAATSTNIVFKAGESATTNLIITLVDDDLAEGPEMVRFTLEQAEGCRIVGPDVHTLFIRDDDAFSIVSANLLSSNTVVGTEAYHDPGQRLLRALAPDIVAVQEWVVTNAGGFAAFVTANFGSGYSYVTDGTVGAGAIPNGIISRWPIVQTNVWEDFVGYRQSLHAKIDLPGLTDLNLVCVHFKAGDATEDVEARTNAAYSVATNIAGMNFGTSNYLAIAGDLNTSNRNEAALAILTNLVSDAKKPKDKAGSENSNEAVTRPYDYVLPDTNLEAMAQSVYYMATEFADGFIFDTREWGDHQHPALGSDSEAPELTHRPVMKVFALGEVVDPPAAFSATAMSPTNIDLSITANAAGHTNVMAYNTTGLGDFTTPAGPVPAVGGSFAGGTVLYVGTDSSYSHTGLVACTEYFYAAWAVSDARAWSPGTNDSATTEAPAAPAAVWASDTNNNDFTADWTASPGATNYYIDVSTNAAFGVAGGGGSIYTVDFDSETKASYAPGNVTLNGISWNLNEAVIGSLVGDRYNGVASARVRSNETVNSSGILSMNADTNMGLSSITLLYAKYSTDNNTSGRVEWSTNSGTSWATAGTFTASSTTLTLFEATNINVSGNVRIRVIKTTETAQRYNIDDIKLYPYGGSSPSYVAGYSNRVAGAGTSISVTGLTSAVAYYFRVRAEAGCPSGDSPTGMVTTTTAATAPTVTTPTVASIDTTTATLGATLTANGGDTVTDYGVVWDTATAPETTDNKVQESTTQPSMPATYDVSATSLPVGTKIYYRGYATNTVDTAYSAEGSFYTEPAQATGIGFSDISAGGMTISWTKPATADGVIVVMKTDGTLTAPTDGTLHAGNTVFATGDNLGASGSYVVYRGSDETVTVSGLTAGTPYYVEICAYKGEVVDAGNDKGINYQQSSPLADNEPTSACSLGAPTSTAATSVGATSFTANWGAVSGASSYRLDVGTYADFTAPIGVNEGFAGGTTPPAGWTFTTITETYTGAGYFGADSPSLKMTNSNARVQTPPLTSPTNVSFWIRGVSTDASSSLLVESADGGTWSTVANLVPLPTTGTNYAYVLSTSVTNLRFTYTRSAGNLAFDDVIVTGSATEPYFVPGYSNRTVAGTSQSVTGLTYETTYYYRVRAFGPGNCTSDNSGNQSATTTAAAAVWDGEMVGDRYNWGNKTNWVGDVLPATNDWVVFYQDISGTNVNLNGDRTVQGVRFMDGASRNVNIRSNTLTIHGGGISVDEGSTGAHAIRAEIAMAQNQVWNNASAVDLILGGWISGSRTANKTGTGRIVLTGQTNSFTGVLTISEGALQIRGTNALGATSAGAGTVVADGATLEMHGGGKAVDFGDEPLTLNGLGVDGGGALRFVQNGVTFPGWITLGSDARIQAVADSPAASAKIIIGTNTLYVGVGEDATELRVGGNLSGTRTDGDGAFVKDGLGVLMMSGDNTNLTGNLSINEGEIRIGAARAMYGTGKLIFGTNSVLKANSAADYTITRPVELNSDIVLGETDTRYGSLIFTNTVNLQGENRVVEVLHPATDRVEFQGVVSNGGLTKAGSGKLILSGTNTYAGGTQVDVGTLQGTTYSLPGDIGNSATLAFQQDSDGTYAGTISGPGEVSKDGTGAVTFTGAQLYTGSTMINGGTLIVTGSAADSEHWIAAGGALMGDGPVGDLIVDGTVNPGDTENEPGLLAVNGTISLSVGGTYRCEIESLPTGTAGTDWDLIEASGAITVNALSDEPFTIQLVGDAADLPGFDPTEPYSWTIIRAPAGSIANFSADRITVDSSDFEPSPGAGSFGVEDVDGSLVLCFKVPEISVRGLDGAEIADGEGTPSIQAGTDFGDVALNQAVAHTFTVTNTGGAPVTLSNVVVGGAQAVDFVVTAQVSSPVAEEGGTAFTVTFTPTNLSAYAATVYLTNSIPANSPYDFALAGEGIIPAPSNVLVLADGSEMVRMWWNKHADYDVMIVHRANVAPADPTQGTPYAAGESCGGGTVLYKGSAATLEHIVPEASTNHYAFYSVSAENSYSAPERGEAFTPPFPGNLVIEPFAYTNSLPLATLNGGKDWSDAWSLAGGSEAFTIGTNTLAAAISYAVPGGNLASSTMGDDERAAASRYFLAPNTTSNIYLGWVMNVSTSGPNRYAGLEVLGGVGGTSVLFQVGLPAGQTNAAVQSWTAAGTPVRTSAFEIVHGVDYTFIAKYVKAANTLHLRVYTASDIIDTTQSGETNTPWNVVGR